MAFGRIDLKGGLSVTALPPYHPKESSPLGQALGRLRGPRSKLERYEATDHPTYDLKGVVQGLDAIPEGHFLHVDTYQPRRFVNARVSNVVLTQHAKAIGAAGYGFLDEFNVSGSAGLPQSLLEADLSDAGHGAYTRGRTVVERVPGVAIPIGHYGFEIFGHFVLDTLLQVYLFRDQIENGRAKLVHWPLSSSWMCDLLAKVGVPLDGRHILSKPVALLEHAELSSALAGHGVYFPASYSVDFFRWLGSGLAARLDVNKRIYVRRSTSFTRVILNQAELEQRLLERGFSILDPTQASIQQQANAFASAEVVVSAWGSGLTLAPLMRGSRTIVDLLPSSVTDPWFLRQSAVHNLYYQPIVYPSDHTGSGAVDIDLLMNVIDCL